MSSIWLCLPQIEIAMLSKTSKFQIPMSHSLSSWRTAEKISREKLSDGLYTENTLATKMPENGLQPSLGKKIQSSKHCELFQYDKMKVTCTPAFLDQVRQFLSLLQTSRLKIVVVFNTLHLERYNKPQDEPRNSKRDKFSSLT